MKRGTVICTLGLAAIGAAAIFRHSASRPAAATEIPAVTRTEKFARNTRPQTDPSKLLERIRAAQASGGPTAVFSRLAALVHADPQAAARFAEANDDAGTREMILHRVAQLWAGRDAAASLAWAASLTDPAERDSLVTDVCLELATRDPAKAVLALGEGPHGALEALAQRWAEKDFTAARDWTLSRPEGGQRDRLVARLAFQQAQDSPQEAATFAANEISEGKTQTEAVMAVLHQWALRDPAAAGNWVEAFSEGDLRTRAVNELDGIAQSLPASDR